MFVIRLWKLCHVDYCSSGIPFIPPPLQELYSTYEEMHWSLVSIPSLLKGQYQKTIRTMD